MSTVRTTTLKVLIAAGFIWAVAVAGLLLFRHQLIYPFRDWPRADQVSGLPGAWAHSFPAADGTKLIAWRVAPKAGNPVVLYFMGNAGSLPSAAPRLAEFVHRGYGVVALNYRGAGGMPGEPSQDALTADALAAYDLAAESGPPILYGTSLGAAVAVQVAVRRPAKAVILETPFARLCETAEHHYPLIPACLVMWDETWESAARIGEITAPLLIQHGDADRLIPFSQGEALFEAATEPKQMIVYPGGRHNDLRLHGAGSDAIDFVEGLTE